MHNDLKAQSNSNTTSQTAYQAIYQVHAQLWGQVTVQSKEVRPITNYTSDPALDKISQSESWITDTPPELRIARL